MTTLVKDPIDACGGCPHNVLVTLSKLGVSNIPLWAMGLVGGDEEGQKVIQEFKDFNINTKFIDIDPLRRTSFTDVFTNANTGNRTFFHYTGANATLDYTHFLSISEKSNAKIFFLGNLLHLDKLDSDDDEYGMRSARVLKMLSDKGFKTAVDLVSVKSDDFAKVVKYCLKYIDYMVINEIEAQSMSNLIIRDESNNLNKENLIKSGEFLINSGIRELLVIHYPEGSYAIDKDRNVFFQDSYKVQKEDIKSAVGCGDAFNAAVLYSLHENLPIQEALKIGNASARFCLFDYTTTGGCTTLENLKKFIESQP
jgi:sugar/nucleoside kinase (ribokinase family)